MTPCRFGIIGAGLIAARFCDAVNHVKGAVVAAVASTSADRAAEFAARCRLPAWYASYEAMLQNADIDAVYIATTHNFHKENILSALSYGKHVLCEKPMVLTRADAEDVFREAAKRGLFLMEAMWSCFLPAYQKAKEWVESGRIGTPHSAIGALGFHSDQDPENRILNPALAGGGMYDIGVYAIEPLRYLIGEPILDAGGMWRPHTVTGVDERAAFLYRTTSCDVALQCSISANVREFSILNGTEGYIEFPCIISLKEVRLYDKNRCLAEEFKAPWQNGFEFQIEHMLRCLAEGKLTSDVVTPAITIESAAVYDAVLRGIPMR